MSEHEAPLITFTPRALERIHQNMGGNGRMLRKVRVSLECVRGVWIVDAKPSTERNELVLYYFYGMREICDLVSLYATKRAKEQRNKGAWRMPPLSTAYRCDDGRTRTVGQMLEGISVEMMPKDEVDFDALLVAYGCDWTHPLVPTMHPCGMLA